MIEYVPDHAARAVADMLSQDQSKPRLVAVIRAAARAFQCIEDLAFDLIVSNTVENATGALLDRWGRVVGEARGGLDDEAYRGFVRARMAANVSGGTTDELLSIIASVTAPAVVQQVDLFPAAFALIVSRAQPLPDLLRERVRGFVRDLKAAGVGLTMIEKTGNPFTYDDGPGFDVGELSRIL